MINDNVKNGGLKFIIPHIYAIVDVLFIDLPMKKLKHLLVNYLRLKNKKQYLYIK